MTRVNLKEEGKQCVTIQVEEARDPNVSGGPVGRESSSALFDAQKPRGALLGARQVCGWVRLLLRDSLGSGSSSPSCPVQGLTQGTMCGKQWRKGSERQPAQGGCLRAGAGWPLLLVLRPTATGSRTRDLEQCRCRRPAQPSACRQAGTSQGARKRR